MQFVENYRTFDIYSGTDDDGDYHALKRNGSSFLYIYDKMAIFKAETPLEAIRLWVDDFIEKESNGVSIEGRVNVLESRIEGAEAILISAILEGVL